jgi:hypothetical protein
LRGVPREICITHLCDSEQLKVSFGDLLREERVERDPVLCEPLNEDVRCFVDPNLGTKSCVSLVLLYLPICLLLFTFLLSISCVRSSLFSISLVVLILLIIVLVAH